MQIAARQSSVVQLKGEFHVALEKVEKLAVLEKYRRQDTDTGSTDVQIALLSSRISELTEHFKLHKHDHHSLRGLLRLVGQRRRLLSYLKRTNAARYRTLIVSLGIRG